MAGEEYFEKLDAMSETVRGLRNSVMICSSQSPMVFLHRNASVHSIPATASKLSKFKRICWVMEEQKIGLIP